MSPILGFRTHPPHFRNSSPAPSLLLSTAMPQATATRSKRSVAVPSILGDQLPLWSERVRGAPNVLARSALFTCADKRAPRRRFERTLIATLEGSTIYYTGEELRQDDLTVWLQVCHLARMTKLGDHIEVTARGLAATMMKQGGGTDLTSLRESIARLREGMIWVNEADGNGWTGNLIAKLHWSEAGNNSREKWKMGLDEKILALFQPDTYTLQDWAIRLKLKPAQQWLYGFFASHANPFAYKPETLHKLSGSTATLASWRKIMKRALDGLVESNMIQDYVETKTTVRVIHKSRQDALPAPEMV
ncbi:MAG: hypothetical protein E6R08_00740 [Nevskiaceae bacterium]|nr:MAG: hypothetical protein E6R08_00740 [Nevskiaceae bacterium]